MRCHEVLITGATGFVGLNFRELARQKGLLVRSVSRAKGISADMLVRDIGPRVNWSAALEGIDVIVHLAARVHIVDEQSGDALAEFRRVNVEGTVNLAKQAVETGARRFIFISSVKVNGEKTLRESPFAPRDIPAPRSAYAISKYEAEQKLHEIHEESSLDVVIIRPPLIYGPGVKANFRKLIEAVDRGIPLPFGSIQNRRSFLSLTNLVDLIYRCIEHPQAAGQTFLASDGEDVSTPELVRRIAKALGRPARLLPVPEWLMKLGGTITGKSAEVERLCGSLQIDSSKARQVLGWTPPCSMEEELMRVAEWWKSSDFAD